MESTKRLFAVRGAVCCENTRESIAERVPELYLKLCSINNIPEQDMVSVVFSVTSDLNVLNPATALRIAGYAVEVPLFACAEPFIHEGLSKVIRVLITFYGDKPPQPVYIHGAEVLRPDIACQ